MAPGWVTSIRFQGLKFPIYLFSPETTPHETTSLHLAPTPHTYHPKGWFHHPQTHVGEPHLWVRTHHWAYMALGMGGQNGRPAEIFLPYSYHGYYQGFPYHTISYQFTYK
jgi:hypothetical protein